MPATSYRNGFTSWRATQKLSVGEGVGGNLGGCGLVAGLERLEDLDWGWRGTWRKAEGEQGSRGASSDEISEVFRQRGNQKKAMNEVAGNLRKPLGQPVFLSRMELWPGTGTSRGGNPLDEEQRLRMPEWPLAARGGENS